MRSKPFPKHLLRIAVASGLLAAAFATPASAEDKTPAGDDTVIATINGEPYKLDVFRLFYAQRLQQTGGENSADLQERAFNEFMNLVVSSQEGEKRKLAERPDVQAALELERMMVLSTAALQAIAADTEVTDKELKQAYEQFKQQAKRTEYKARHILVDNKEKAEELAKEVTKKKGKNFEKLAKENSLGPTADKGGDLGWFDGQQMVKPFADAVAKLKPGEWTKEPVHTQFGWHVILLEDTRDAEPPSFEDAKPSLEAAIKRQKVAEKLAELRNQAMVELNEDVVKLKDDGGEKK
ncbi:MAG: peptidyl-prolyl cis-trans isomerase [Thiohalocapsa sp.]|jgi:peptidyl-prolyl cis-trans isomerase C|uniref:peptidylprolyl isomerase n=1 Tax=Thiohalocapsa sp. TaxID=2497641 RepID=UPI0025EFFC7D|nr:peptidyl-prolyl cis-trans isomerase [Thiohalocapsa sp.]MCG6940187.1 peptidyl-prolyl cis-trans isomerase [Thiohalocapsa sp.]